MKLDFSQSLVGGTWKPTETKFSTTIQGKPAEWTLWNRWVKGSKMTGDYPTYVWSARDPNPGVMHSRDFRITDRYKPPAGTSEQDSVAKATEWAKQFALPTPEQQGENLALRLQKLTASGSQDINQNYDPSVTLAQPDQKSKLPWIIGGVTVLAVVAALWWKFRR